MSKLQMDTLKEKENSKPDMHQKELTKGDIIAYGLGSGPATLTNQFKTQFFMPFLSDIVGLNIGTVGLWSSFMTIFDAINDPIIGGLADRTNTKRWGKYRPHMMIGSIMLAIVMVLMFTVPNLSESGQMFYYIFLMALFTVFTTQFTVPWQALNSIMSSEPHQRNLLLTSRQFIGFIATSITGIIFVPIVGSFADEKTGWLAASVLVGIICLITGLLCARGARKKDYYLSIPTPEKLSYKSQINLVIKNRAVICTALILGLVTLINAISGAINMYYARYVVGNVKIIAIMSMCTLGLSFVMFPFIPAILKRIGKNKALVVGLLLMLPNSVMLIIMREKATIPMIACFHTLSGIGFLIANVCALGMIPDCTDYTEYHFGAVQAGFINAIIMFARKFFRSFSTVIVGGLLGYVGYNLNPNTPEVMNMIINIKIASSWILAGICFVVLKFYPITPAYGKTMREALKKRRNAPSN